jgi:antitoxin component YwqK of YwqJK toxin-antitoxin module
MSTITEQQSQSNPVLKEVITYYSKGNVIKEIYSVGENNELEGPYKCFEENGQICIICNYSNGKRVGNCFEFVEGKKWKECTYNEDGLTEGPYIEWWKNGQTRISGNCKNGNFVGEYVSRWENGNLAETCFYNEEGKKEGPYAQYSEDGTFKLEKFYKNGVEVKKEEVEKPVQMITYYNGVMNGNSKVVKEVYYAYPSSGVKHGLYNLFGVYGNIQRSCNYINGKVDEETLKVYNIDGGIVTI